MKLSKSQTEFFEKFARNAVAGVLFPALEARGFHLPEGVRTNLIDNLDVKDLTKSIGEHFLGQTDFKTLQKVDKFMRSEEYNVVAEASAAVFVAVEKELLEIVLPLIPSDETIAAMQAAQAESGEPVQE